MSPPPSLKPGTLLAGKLRVLSVLGTGGMGAVYAVEHELTKHVRALKVLHPHTVEMPEIVTRFLREASAAGRIGNAHICETFDAGTLDTGEPYVVMELLKGRTLGGRVAAEGKLALPDIVEIVAQACDGVQAAHDAGIIHRDLKPDNLFLTTRDGAPFVKVLDFGISKFDPSLTSTDAKATTEGAALGTPLYMSPEQIWGRADIDGRTDVWSLGVVLYECATGLLPFQAGSIGQLAVLIHEGKPTPIGAHRPDLPPAFGEIVTRAMTVDRAQRTRTVATLAAELRALLSRVAEVRALAATEMQPSVEVCPVPPNAVVGPVAEGVTAPRRRTVRRPSPSVALAVVGAFAVGGWAVASWMRTPSNGTAGPDVQAAAPSSPVPVATATATVDIVPTAVPPAPVSAAATPHQAASSVLHPTPRASTTPSTRAQAKGLVVENPISK